VPPPNAVALLLGNELDVGGAGDLDIALDDAGAVAPPLRVERPGKIFSAPPYGVVICGLDDADGLPALPSTPRAIVSVAASGVAALAPLPPTDVVDKIGDFFVSQLSPPAIAESAAEIPEVAVLASVPTSVAIALAVLALDDDVGAVKLVLALDVGAVKLAPALDDPDVAVPPCA